MRRILGLILLLTPGAFAYIQLTNGSGTPLIRTDNTGINFFLNNQVVAGVQSSAASPNVTVITAGSNPQQAIHAALATWNGIGSSIANIHFNPLQSTTAGINPNDMQMTIAIASSQSDLSFVGSALALTRDSYNAAGTIVDSDIIINPAYTFSTIGEQQTYDFQSVMTHEFGHALGANHTGLIGATMFQTVYENNAPVERIPSTDDLAFAEVVYPSAKFPATLGTVSGTVTSGSSPVSYALLTLTDTSTGNTVGGLAGANGTFSIVVPSATYQVYAEPLTEVVKIGNLINLSGTPSTFQPALASAPVNVGIGSTATANISVNGGSSSFGVPYVGVTSVGGSAGGVSFYPGGPVYVPSGGSVDLLLAGTGFTSSLSASNFNVIGPGITVGAVKADSNGGTVNGAPVIHVTLNVAAQQFPSLDSIFVTNGSNTFSMSGALVVGPPTPTTTPQSIVSSASFQGNAVVSPGEISALFDIPNTPNLGPSVPLGNTGYDPYGFLASTLGDVNVTFNGVPAPLFFVSGGQINLQVPFEVAGKTSAQMMVSYYGSASAAYTVSVQAAQPSIYTTCAEGGAEVSCIVNANGSINGPTSAASPGDTVTVYGTGVGVLPNPTNGYNLQTGGSAPDPPISANGYTCTIGGVNAQVTFAGWSATAVGLAQWDVVVPSSLTAAGQLPLVCTNGSQSTQSGVTIYVN